MTTRILIITILAAIPLLAACSSSNTSGMGGLGGGGTTTTTTSTTDGCGGQPHYALAGDVCVDGFSPGCVSDTVQSFPCTSDADCANGASQSGFTVCRMCTAQQGFCDTSCTVSGKCPGGGTCDAGGHCTLKSCTADADCPANFTCSPTDSLCERKTCAADADCNGYCFSGHCTETPASCIDCT
jgi:hypothetical protein